MHTWSFHAYQKWLHDYKKWLRTNCLYFCEYILAHQMNNAFIIHAYLNAAKHRPVSCAVLWLISMGITAAARSQSYSSNSHGLK